MSEPAHPTYLLLKRFLEERPVCARAAAPMKPEASVRILFDDHEQIYIFRNTAEGPRLVPGVPERPDFTLRIPRGMAEHLNSMESDDIGEFGVVLVSLGSAPDPRYHITPAIHGGFWTLWRRGYFRILRMGGWPMAKLLAAKGLVSIRVIREKVNQNVRPVD